MTKANKSIIFSIHSVLKFSNLNTIIECIKSEKINHIELTYLMETMMKSF